MDRTHLEAMVSQAKMNGSCRCSLDIFLLKSLVRINAVDVKVLNRKICGNGYVHSVIYDGVELTTTTKSKIYF